MENRKMETSRIEFIDGSCQCCFGALPEARQSNGFVTLELQDIFLELFHSEVNIFE